MAKIIRYITRLACSLVLKMYPHFKVTWYYHLRTFVVFSSIGIFLIIMFVFSTVDLSRVYALKNYKPPLPSTILDRKGRVISQLFIDHRILIKSSEIPLKLEQAFIAMEDNHFYSHWGMDLQAILRAFLINFKHGTVKQGGSTITQQLAKVILTSKKRTYIRKAKEAILALYLDALYPKKEILTLYFNQIYFGHGNYGVEAASQFYFKKSVSKLNIAQYALLAGLPSAPNRYSPLKNPRYSREKVSQVLMKMIDRGFITAKEAQKSYKELMPYYASLNFSSSDTAFGRRIDKAPYFTEFIRQKLEKEIGKKLLYKGGLVIHTSLDLDHQLAAQESLWQGLTKQNRVSRKFIFNKHLDFGKKYSHSLDLIKLIFDLPEFQIKRSYAKYQQQIHFYRNLLDNVELLNFALGGEIKMAKLLSKLRLSETNPNRYRQVEGALIELDHKTGEVTAMVGGNPFSSQNQINRTVQMKRQPGSTFKPLLYAAAIDKGLTTAATIYPDSPLVFLNVQGGEWIPENYSSNFSGFISLREALRMSVNMVSIAMAREVGLGNILPTLDNMLNVPPKTVPYNLSVALGSFEVSPLQLAQAFSLFARGGTTLPAIFIKKITDSEMNVIKYFDHNEFRKKAKQVISKGAATVVNSLLRNVVNHGTASGIRSRYRGYAAGKTGTTQNFRDAWFAGFNKRYTAVVWLGYDRSSISLGPGQAGGAIAAPIWADFQARTVKFNSKDKPYIIQGGTTSVLICKGLGKRPGPACENSCTKTYSELFVIGKKIPEVCDEEQNIDENDSSKKVKKDLMNKSDFFNEDDE